MQRLHHALAPKVPGRTVMPGNAEAVELRFNDDHTVAVMGRLVRARSQRGAAARTSLSHVPPPPAGRPEAGGGGSRAGPHGGQGALVRAAGGARPHRAHRADEAQSVADRAHPLPLGGSGAAGWWGGGGGKGARSPRRLCGAARFICRVWLLMCRLAHDCCPLHSPSLDGCTRRRAALTIAAHCSCHRAHFRRLSQA
jgi:hypothetical protein